jgi:protein involved in polysaccharide export with SLBB domain
VQLQFLTNKIKAYALCLAASMVTFVLGAQGGAYAQSPNMQAAMQAYQSMSPDQQQAIIQKLGGQVAGLGGGPGNSSGQNSSNQNQSQANMQPGSAAAQAAGQNGQGNTPPKLQIPVFGPDDWVLLDINLPGEKSVAQQAADNYARELNASAIEQLTGQAAPALQNQQQQNANNQAQQGSNNPAPGPLNPTTLLPPINTSPGGTPGTTTLGRNDTSQPQLPKPILSAQDQRKLDDQHDLIKMLRANNPYQLDHDGTLQLPGFRAIALAGLTEAEATRRVASEPSIEDFEIRVSRLPIAKSGREALQPYGYDLFLNPQPGLSPVTSTPVPADYVLGPDDVLEVQLYGNQNYTVDLTVNRDGQINFPQLGAISVGGKRYSAVKSELEARVGRQMIGEHASVSMSGIRTISVFVLGEAMFPGSYTVSGLATVTSALFAAGGVKPQGSLRHIQVRRQGALVREFDLYDLLMRGDSSADVKLLPGDVVMVPSIGPTASAYGEVQRPAIYELKGPTDVAQLIDMAGGLTPEADNATASLLHVNAQRQRVVIGVNPSAPAGQAQPVGNGDALRVVRLKPTIDSGIQLQGYVYRPGGYEWHQGLRLTDIIGSIDELKPNADQHYVLIRRVEGPGRQINVLSADLAAALKAPDSSANVLLQPRDTLTVFDLQTGRDRVIEPLMQELTLQADLQQPTQIVNIDGKVKVPGDYPLESGMHVADLIRAGGGLDASAYGGRAELSRYTVDNGEQRRTEIISIDLAAVARGDTAANFELRPFDKLSIKEITGWTEQDQVIVIGEVRFPGMYTIKHGETLRSVMARAGGLTEYAFPAGALFTRESLREFEQEQLDRLTARMQSDIAATALMAARANQTGATSSYNVGQSLLAQLQATRAIGRLVIDLKASMNARPGSADDIILRNGDQLIVPKQRQDVMVLGEVQSPSAHLFRPDLSRDDYISQSGGVTSMADKSKIYVVRADGSVAPHERRWLFSSSDADMRAGDAVVVPLDTESLPNLPTWQAVSQIMYQLAIAVVAVHAL